MIVLLSMVALTFATYCASMVVIPPLLIHALQFSYSLFGDIYLLVSARSYQWKSSASQQAEGVNRLVTHVTLSYMPAFFFKFCDELHFALCTYNR